MIKKASSDSFLLRFDVPYFFVITASMSIYLGSFIDAILAAYELKEHNLPADLVNIMMIVPLMLIVQERSLRFGVLATSLYNEIAFFTITESFIMILLHTIASLFCFLAIITELDQVKLSILPLQRKKKDVLTGFALILFGGFFISNALFLISTDQANQFVLPDLISGPIFWIFGGYLLIFPSPHLKWNRSLSNAMLFQLNLLIAQSLLIIFLRYFLLGKTIKFQDILEKAVPLLISVSPYLTS